MKCPNKRKPLIDWGMIDWKYREAPENPVRDN
jgi:hypothetical protein